MTETELGAKTKLFLGAREAYVEESGSKFCPQLQILQNLRENENLYLNINKSMRAPNVNEQWGTSTQVMNPDLKAESGWNYELGWKKKFTDRDLLKLNVSIWKSTTGSIVPKIVPVALIFIKMPKNTVIPALN